MPDCVYELCEAEPALSDLVERVARGEEIVIVKGGRAMAKLVPATAPRRPREPGGWTGRVRIGRDFDAPLPADFASRD